MKLNEKLALVERETAATRQRFNDNGGSYEAQLLETMELIEGVQKGRKPSYLLAEAMSTDDFPNLLGDVIDRYLVGAYQEHPTVWPAVARRAVVPNFNESKRYAVDGAEAPLDEVDELAEYPIAALNDSADTLVVTKYGRRLDLSMEAIINDDFGDLANGTPAKLARAARRTEDLAVTRQYVGAAGPNSTLYGTFNGQTNVVPGNPALTIEGLQKAFEHIGAMTDEDGNPIYADRFTLVVGPALEVVARNVLNALSIDISGTSGGGTSSQTIRAANWVGERVSLVVNPWIPSVATSNAGTSWWLFADPNSGRAAIEIGFLRSAEQPVVYEKVPDSRPVGGGATPSESFDSDSRAWKVRHIIGTAALVNTGGWRSTVASNGTGS